MTSLNTVAEVFNAWPAPGDVSPQMGRAGAESHYRAIHQRTDCEIAHLAGLCAALDLAVEAHPSLSGPEPETAAIRSTVQALTDRVQRLAGLQLLAWQEMGGSLPG